MMHRFYISDDEFNIKSFSPNSILKKQIEKVLRIKEHENILIINSGREYLANYINGIIIIKKMFREENDNENRIKFFLIQSLSNHSSQKIILQKATEIGVDGIYFFASQYSNYKIADEKEKFERHYKILKEASEQSNRLSIPELNYLENLNELSTNENDLLLFAYEKATEKIKEIIKTTFFGDKNNNKKTKRIFVIVGPEGGFSENEAKNIIKLKFKPIKLTDNILRTETAAIYLLSLMSIFI